MRRKLLERMEILYLLVPLSVVLVFVTGAVFWLALKGGQFDDLESPGLNVVLDDDTAQSVSSSAQQEGESQSQPGEGDGGEPRR